MGNQLLKFRIKLLKLMRNLRMLKLLNINYLIINIIKNQPLFFQLNLSSNQTKKLKSLINIIKDYLYKKSIQIKNISTIKMSYNLN